MATTEMPTHSPLKRIAEIVGVSKMTVSRALREGTSVTPALRKEIRDTAQKLGYQPDSLISQAMRAVRRAQSSSYRETLAFVRPDRFAPTPSAPDDVDQIFAGALRRALDLGYRIDDIRLSEISRSGQGLSSVLTARSIRGVLIGPGTPTLATSNPKLEWPRFSCVLVGISFASLGLPRVQHDHYLGCELAMRRLTHLRYQRIALVLPAGLEERTARLIRSAFCSFHPQSLKHAERLIFTSEGTDLDALRKSLHRESPEAIIALFEQDFPSPAELRALAPENCALVSLNWTKRHSEIAGIDQHPQRIGFQAVDLLLLRLHSNQMGLDTLAPAIRIPGSWKRGALPISRANPVPA